MNRIIKFRAWDNHGSIMYEPFKLNELFGSGLCYPQLRNNPDIIFMQFTGLKDKNGVDIYGSYLVRIKDKTWEVAWDRDIAGFLLLGITGVDNIAQVSSGEVIGNIYENPELLEQEKEGK